MTATLRPDFPHALLTPAEMAEADRLAGASIPLSTLMENAGRAVAERVRLLAAGATGGTIVVLCGPGNNGGDGYVAARLLAEDGLQVVLAAVANGGGLRGDAAGAASRWPGAVLGLGEVSFDEAMVVVDALFGAGLGRDLEGEVAAVVRRANAWRHASGRPLVAVDVPSGLDGATGRPRGLAIEASDTVTFFRLKPGHVLLPGRSLCGALHLVDIGLPRHVLNAVRPAATLNTPSAWLRALGAPSLDGHKYTRGHALVVSGPLARTGAARLAARGALRAGAGLVTVATPAEALPIHAAALTAIMTRVAEDAAGLAVILEDDRKNAVVLGPGLGVGAGTRALVRAALLSPAAAAGAPARAVVLDADALVSFAEEPEALFALVAKSEHAVVLTPHDGEFVKLFGTVLDAGAAKPERVRAAAAASGAVVVLKGPDTTIAHPDKRVSIAMSEAPWLATAGSGDVLAGMIAGLLAQGTTAFAAAAAAVWMHAEAARRFGAGLISEDLPDALPPVLQTLFDAKQRSGPISDA